MHVTPTLEVVNVRGVKSDFSWDTTPFDNTSLVDVIPTTVTTTDTTTDIYTCYAPYVVVTVKSELLEKVPDAEDTTVDTTTPPIVRTIDFNDYYNSSGTRGATYPVEEVVAGYIPPDTSYTTSLSSSEANPTVVFWHTYMMPGTYSITLTSTEYIAEVAAVEEANKQESDPQVYKQPQEVINTENLQYAVVTENPLYIKIGTRKVKVSRDASANSTSIYLDVEDYEAQDALNSIKLNDLVTLEPTYLDPYDSTKLYSKGDRVTSNDKAYIYKYNTSAKGKVPTSTTYWELLSYFANGTKVTAIQNNSQLLDYGKVTISPGLTRGIYVTRTKKFPLPTTKKDTIVTTNPSSKAIKIQVNEINPECIIEKVTATPTDNTLKVEVTAKDSTCGSFPIERITWDMGDGSPLKEQVLWLPNKDVNSFKSNGLYTNDTNDPRNYNVVHTYKLDPITQKRKFTVKATVYAANTNTSNSMSLLVDASIEDPTTITPTNVTIVSCEPTDKGKVFIGKVDNTLVAWTSDK